MRNNAAYLPESPIVYIILPKSIRNRASFIIFVLRIDNIKYMYKKKIPLDLDCGVAIAMEVMGGKWKSCILYELEKGCKRPSELHRHFEDTSPRVINQQLKELEMHGMIEKTIYPELPPHVEYSITDDGRSLIPIIRMLEQWGNDFRPKMVRILEKTGMAE